MRGANGVRSARSDDGVKGINFQHVINFTPATFMASGLGNGAWEAISKPWSNSGCARRSFTRLMIKMVADQLACIHHHCRLPQAQRVPATAARSMSPVEICGMHFGR